MKVYHIDTFAPDCTIVSFELGKPRDLISEYDGFTFHSFEALRLELCQRLRNTISECDDAIAKILNLSCEGVKDISQPTKPRSQARFSLEEFGNSFEELA